jgi:hypothetical protein
MARGQQDVIAGGKGLGLVLGTYLVRPSVSMDPHGVRIDPNRGFQEAAGGVGEGSRRQKGLGREGRRG